MRVNNMMKWQCLQSVMLLIESGNSLQHGILPEPSALISLVLPVHGCSNTLSSGDIGRSKAFSQ